MSGKHGRRKKPAGIPGVTIARVRAAYGAAAPVFVLSGAFPTGRRRAPGLTSLRGAGVVRDAYRDASAESIWVAPASASLAPLTCEVARPASQQRLLVLSAIDGPTQALYGTFFRHVFAPSPGVQVLDRAELQEVLASPERDERFIAASYVAENAVVVLTRGNLESLVVPLTWFRNAASSAALAPAEVAIIDGGQTVRLGAFEASTDAILYEFDAEYRRAARKRRLAEDTSLGASIRRLRLQNNVARDDFPGVTEKAIARIERNEVSQPHMRTLERIAERLAVTVESLPTY